jgi:omega-amidase
MIQPLIIAGVQTFLHWEDKAQNLHMLSEKLRAYTEPADVFVLPELFSTGFTMNAKAFAEPANGPTFKWMVDQARLKNAAITGSIIIEEGGQFYNRMMWVNPDGTSVHYDKRHLFRMAGEDQHYAPGNHRVIIQYKGWRICLMVCYDLRFPVWSRNRFRNNDGAMECEYDLLVYVANWPERRAHAWKTLLMARAIENLAYVVGVNRVGNDGNFIYHSGDSGILNFKGEVMRTGIISAEEIISDALSMQDLVQFRKAFPAGMDADAFTVGS